ncbi:hypothetical protein Ancab_038058 [Ancistrocladus abbreviatus]
MFLVQCAASLFARCYGVLAKVDKWIQWEQPLEQCVELNVDGSMQEPNNAGTRDLIGDHMGRWVCGFYKGLVAIQPFEQSFGGLFFWGLVGLGSDNPLAHCQEWLKVSYRSS